MTKEEKAEKMAALFGGDGEVIAEKVSKGEPIELPINDCIPYHNHKFTVRRSNYEDFVESIKTFGVITPIIVRPYQGKFEIIAGHRRHQASIDAGKTTVPAIIKVLSDSEAWLIVSETNIQQSAMTDLKHSERADVIYDYHQALKAQGKRTDLINEVQILLSDIEKSDEDETFGLSDQKLNSAVETGKGFSLSPRTVGRYLRIYKLIDELKKLLDEEILPFHAAVLLSYLSEENQMYLSEIINTTNKRIDIKKADQMKKLEKQKKLNEFVMQEILNGTFEEKVKSKVSKNGFKPMKQVYVKYFKAEQSQKEIEDIIDQALEMFFNK